MTRAKTLLDAGAMAAKDYEVAQDTEDKAKVSVETAEDISVYSEPIKTIQPRLSMCSRPYPESSRISRSPLHQAYKVWHLQILSRFPTCRTFG